MATAAEILTVRKGAKLWRYAYFADISGTKLEMIKQQPPITIIDITKNDSTLTADTDYSFNGYRTITLTDAAAESDVFRVECGELITNSEISDVIDSSKEEVYGWLRQYYTGTELGTSTFVADIYQNLAAGYLIMKHWQGYPNGADFWKHGRNLVDTAHKRCTQICDGELQLVSSDTTRIDKSTSPFQYEVLPYQAGLEPSEIYSQCGEDDVDDEVY